MSQTLERFQAYLKKMNLYNRVNTLLSWDMYTAVPKQGYQGMSEALAYFSTEAFSMATSDELGEMLDILAAPEEYEALDEVMQFTVRVMRRELEESRRIPKDFYEAFVVAKSASMQAWQEAKRASDYSIFAPHLEKMIEMTKQQCAFTHPGEDVYDVLLNQYEEGMSSASIDRVFGELKEGLVPLVKKILAAPRPENKITGDYDPARQEKVQALLLEYMGFSRDAGVTAVSEHPFTQGFSRNDVRVTNHYYQDNPLSAIFSAIHEGGHAIFGQNVNPALEGTPADDCRYMGIHESQSRFYENMLGRNRNFWVPIYNQVQELLPGLKSVSLDDFSREINRVENSLIRTEADEVTYGLHIIIRYEIEQAIFRDHVPASQLPALWNQKMEEYLQITPPDDARGILQDMHWADGSFGYFPSYLLGNIYDGMFLEAITRDLGSLDAILAEGRILDITRWLNTHIHWYGGLRLPAQVIREVCKRELTAKPLLDYFTEKYTRIYKL